MFLPPLSLSFSSNIRGLPSFRARESTMTARGKEQARLLGRSVVGERGSQLPNGHGKFIDFSLLSLSLSLFRAPARTHARALQKEEGRRKSCAHSPRYTTLPERLSSGKFSSPPPPSRQSSSTFLSVPPRRRRRSLREQVASLPL